MTEKKVEMAGGGLANWPPVDASCCASRTHGTKRIALEVRGKRAIRTDRKKIGSDRIKTAGLRAERRRESMGIGGVRESVAWAVVIIAVGGVLGEAGVGTGVGGLGNQAGGGAIVAGGSIWWCFGCVWRRRAKPAAAKEDPSATKSASSAASISSVVSNTPNQSDNNPPVHLDMRTIPDSGRPPAGAPASNYASGSILAPTSTSSTEAAPPPGNPVIPNASFHIPPILKDSNPVTSPTPFPPDSRTALNTPQPSTRSQASAAFTVPVVGTVVLTDAKNPRETEFAVEAKHEGWEGVQEEEVKPVADLPHWFFLQLSVPLGRHRELSVPYSGKPCIVDREFQPTSSDELRVAPGQFVQLKVVYRDGWAVGRNLDTGEYGAVPCDCVRVVENRPLASGSRSNTRPSSHWSGDPNQAAVRSDLVAVERARWANGGRGGQGWWGATSSGWTGAWQNGSGTAWDVRGMPRDGNGGPGIQSGERSGSGMGSVVPVGRGLVPREVGAEGRTGRGAGCRRRRQLRTGRCPI
ncbi:hypothetical protein M427DRAFT_441307 [Gonapodya prolifera JEL478]|uniref:SH3 domain-containing protein n=1 Tax=Gonapodya prolifera (strain JEL478) TaxID=1344416 RepID=A0A139A492_GONPJ|nr:hypothetical protein M427DRAFT_441307 [Gonapodya prolifera JEL478]|eukprot:KXS11295.1 hypothetical protein M427DRAFT_441307 [Gonapodya prolifera JEL478]